MNDWVYFLEEANFSSLSIRTSTKTLHHTFDNGLNEIPNYKADLKQGID